MFYQVTRTNCRQEGNVETVMCSSNQFSHNWKLALRERYLACSRYQATAACRQQRAKIESAKGSI